MNWVRKNNTYYKVLMSKPQYHIALKDMVLLRGKQDLSTDQTYMFGLFILDGKISLDGNAYGKETLLFFEGTKDIAFELKDNVHVLFVESEKKADPALHKFRVFDSEKISWTRPLAPGQCNSRHMISSDEYGFKMSVEVYTEGAVVPWHTHHISHGFYVLDGVLEIMDEEQTRLIGPGEFAVNNHDEQVKHQMADGVTFAKYVFITDGPADFVVNGVNLRAKK